jgi:hypothetical protein
MSRIFPSVSTFSLDSFFFLQIESVVHHLLTSCDTYHFLRAHSCMYLQMKPECISYKFIFLQRIWLNKSLLNHVGHCKSNKFRTKIWHAQPSIISIQFPVFVDYTNGGYHQVMQWYVSLWSIPKVLETVPVSVINNSCNGWSNCSLYIYILAFLLHPAFLFTSRPAGEKLHNNHVNLWLWRRRSPKHWKFMPYWSG